ncbi:MAG TPA: hypothetical protein VD866_00010 [Urbifossiella sp.]|nr:hypothetical protein [Urbifossiella sp.]
MKDTRDSLQDLLHGAKVKPKLDEPPPEHDGEPEELTIADMDGKYATMRPANKSLPRIHIVHSDGKVETLYYHHLDAKSEYNGGSFTVLFTGAKIWELTVEGRNLWRLYDYVTLSRWPYIRVAHRDFGGKDEEVVTAARIKEIVIRESE